MARQAALGKSIGSALVEDGIKVVEAVDLSEEFGMIEYWLFPAGGNVDHKQWTRMSLHGCAKLPKPLMEKDFGAGIKKEEDGRLRRQLEFEEVLAERFDFGAKHEVARVRVDVSLRGRMQVR